MLRVIKKIRGSAGAVSTPANTAALAEIEC